MRVAILGVGGLGRTLASELRADPRVTSLLLTDQFGERARVLTGIPGRVSIDASRIRAGDLVPAGAGLLPLSSREAFLADVLARPTVWLENELCVRDPLSEPENFPFPAPVGTQRTYLIAHEEVETLPRFLGKPIGRVDYKHALHPEVVRALVSLDRLGLLSDFRMIRVGNQMVSFRRA